MDLEVGSFIFVLPGQYSVNLAYFYHQKIFFINSIKSLILPANPISFPNAYKTGQNQGKQCPDSRLSTIKTLD